MADEEDYFPRGGFRTTVFNKKTTFAFGERRKVQLPIKKRPGKRLRQKTKAAFTEPDFHEDKINFVRIEPLIYNSLSEGTVALCSIRDVCKNYVDICMPGRLSARLYVDNVSETYTALLDEKSKDIPSLQNLFCIGQHISCSVLSVKNHNHFLVRVTTDPGYINGHMTYDNVGVGSLIQMAVKSCEDHGYMMYSGIDGLISFLPSENAKSYINDVRNFRPLDIGQILWCVVTKSKITESSNTVHVSIDLENVKDNKLEDAIIIEKLNPGVRVEVTINKVVSQNLMVTVGDTEIKGYIEPSHLSSMWSKPSDYHVGSKHIATVLYKYPYPRVVALTLKSNPTTISTDEIKHGTTFKRAEIMSICKRGVLLKLESNNNQFKGFVSVRRLGPNIDYDKLSTMFPVGNHVTCRVIGYDALEQVYSCTTEDNLLNEKYLSPNDLKVGETVEVTVNCLTKEGLEVSIGGIKGYVPPFHISDVLLHNPLDKIKLGSKQKAKVLKVDNNNALYTLRPTLINSASLVDFKNVGVGDAYFGTIQKINPDSMTVTFFGNLFTNISVTNLVQNLNKYKVGELVKCFVVEPQLHKKLPIFSLVKSVQNMDVTVGRKYDLRVKHISKEGLKCLFMVKNRSYHGFLPLEHFSDFRELSESVMKKYSHYSLINNAILFSVTDNIYTFSIKKSIELFFKKNSQIFGGINKLKEGMIIPATVSEIMSDNIMTCVPIPGLNAKVSIPEENLPQKPSFYTLNEDLYVKVLKIIPEKFEFFLTCLLSENEKEELVISKMENILKSYDSVESVKIGTELECTVSEINGSMIKVSTASDIYGYIKSPTLQSHSFHVGQKLKAVVFYHDVKKNVLYFLSPEDTKKMGGIQWTHLINQKVSGKFLFGNSELIIVMVNCPKGWQLAFISTKVDPNSAEHIISDNIVPYSTCNITLRSTQTLNKINYWLGIGSNWKIKQLSSKKRKNEAVDENSNKKQKKALLEKNNLNSVENELVDLEDVDLFKWDASHVDLAKAISKDLDDDGEESDGEELKKKKMTSAEKRHAALETEKIIRQKEEEWLSAETNPQSTEHFERLVFASPNSSKCWIMYMGHHLEAAEIDKARAVAKRAIKQMNITFEEERLALWIARLNLEYKYGTPEEFKEVLTEALKSNDEYEIQKRVLDIYGQSKNKEELENQCNLLVKKYKENIDCWLKCQMEFMKAGMFEKARHYKKRSLQFLPNKEHCTLKSRFALMENQFGFAEEAQEIFQNLLTSYPKRIDLLSVYVDMLVKSGMTDLARNELKRATAQKLPIRKMKAIYQKWCKFEEEHGSPENLQQVKDLANEYVNKLTASLE